MTGEHFTLNGRPVDATTVLRGQFRPRSASESEALAFLKEWYGPAEGIAQQSSGSTGAPKRFLASRDAMRASAALSNRIFGLSAGSTALLALPLTYIAGKMMLVRALVGGLNLQLVDPDSRILSRLDEALGPGEPCRFAPLVPMQLSRALEQPGGLAGLERIDCVLVGGGFVDPALEDALQTTSCRLYASYGMTETFSHIALRRLNGPERSSWYTPLPGVSLRLNGDACLVISAPHLGVFDLATNDRAELHGDGCFRILGRRDAVINSGGIKIQAEALEEQLRAATGLNLLLVGTPHRLLGSCLTLLIDGRPNNEQEQALQRACEALEPHLRPRRRLVLDQLPRTSSGKIARAKAQAIAREHFAAADGEEHADR